MESEEQDGAETRGGLSEETRGAETNGGLSVAQAEVLERCLHALKHAKNDSHLLAALLLITRLCPANQLDQLTLRRIFEAVGLNLPARLLVTAVRGSSDGSGLAPNELLSLGSALLAALSTDPDMAYKPQLLSTVPLLLQILSSGPQPQHRHDDPTGGGPTCQDSRHSEAKPEQKDHSETKPEQKDHSETKPEQKDHSETKPEQKDHSETKPEQKDHSETKPEQKGHSETKPEQKGHSETKPEQKDHSETKPEQEDHSETKPEQEDHSETKPEQRDHSESKPEQRGDHSETKPEQRGDHSSENTEPHVRVDEAVAADCYQVLLLVCAQPLGPEQLASRGAVRALCQAVLRNQTLSRERGLPLLACLLSGKAKTKAWSRNSGELLQLLDKLTEDFSNAPERDRLRMCVTLVPFVPALTEGSESARAVARRVWAVLRPMLQSKLTPKQMGPVLVLGACLLDVCGWEEVGSPKFCCLLVNRACVELRMELEEPPGTSLSPETQHTITACYRIMEAAMEQACLSESQAPVQSSVPGLSLQQSRQVLRVLEEAFSAVIYHLQQVDESRFGEPFVFASFRSLCSWLAEETSCLREEVTALLPFLIGYCRSHMSGGERSELSDWMEQESVAGEQRWTGKEPLRYLLPALCHLSAETGTRQVLLSLDAPLLLVQFVSESWVRVREQNVRDPSVETACSALLNITVTEADAIRRATWFRTLGTLLSEVLLVLVHRPSLVVLGANVCCLGLMMGRLWPRTDSPSPSQTSLLSSALLFLRGALSPGPASGPVLVSRVWSESWDHVSELWRLSVQALSSCVGSQPWVVSLVRDEGWLRHTLDTLMVSSGLPDAETQLVLQEALCAVAQVCPRCRGDIQAAMDTHQGALAGLRQLWAHRDNITA